MIIPIIAGAVGAAAAVFGGMHAMAPKSQLYGKTFFGTSGHGKQIALTYDDGPNDPDTLLLLDVLAKHKVKATFFLIGKYVRQRPDIVRKIAAAGHEIGNHTYEHPNLALVGKERLVNNLLECELALAEVRGLSLPNTNVGSPPEKMELLRELRAKNGTGLFRPPFGGRRPSTLKVVREAGYIPVMWSVICYDWKETTSAAVERHALRQIRGGDVVVMHDGSHRGMGANRRHTVEATDRLITRLKDEGYGFVGVGEMMAL